MLRLSVNTRDAEEPTGKACSQEGDRSTSSDGRSHFFREEAICLSIGDPLGMMFFFRGVPSPRRSETSKLDKLAQRWDVCIPL